MANTQTSADLPPSLGSLLGSVNGGMATDLDASTAAGMKAMKADQDKALQAGLGKAGFEEKAADTMAAGNKAIMDWSAKNPYPNPNIKPFTEKPPVADPVKEFGSWASALGILAGMLTKTPITSSLRASAAAMTAMRQNDLDRYEMHRQLWKDNTDAAIKSAEWEEKGYRNALDLMKDNTANGYAAWMAHAAAAGSQAAAYLGAAGDPLKMIDYQEGLANLRKTAIENAKALDEFQQQGSVNLLADRAFAEMHPELKLDPKDKDLAGKVAALTTPGGPQYNAQLAADLTIARQTEKGQAANREKGKSVNDEDIAKYPGVKDQLYSIPPSQRGKVLSMLDAWQADNPDKVPTADVVEKMRQKATSEGKGPGKVPLDTSSIKDPALRGEIDRYSMDPKHQAGLLNAYDALMEANPKAKPTVADLENEFRGLSKGPGNQNPLSQYLAQKQQEVVGAGGAWNSAAIASATAEFNRVTKPVTISELDAQQIQKEMADPENKGKTYEEIKQQVMLKNKAGLTDDDAKFVAGMVIAGNPNAASGYGKSPADKALISRWVRVLANEQHITPADLVVRQAEYTGMQAGQRAVAQRFINVSAASHELVDHGGMIDQAREAAAKFHRTNFPIANAALKAFETNTGDPAIRDFGATLQAIENTYAQLIARGAVSTDSARLAAHNLVTAVDSPAAFETLMHRLQIEANIVLQAPGDVRRDLDAMVSGSTAASGANDAPVALGQADPDAVYDALPPGTRYLAPDGSGRIGVKPFPAGGN